MLFLLENLFLVSEAVSKCDVLESELCDFLILLELTLLFHTNVLLRDLLAGSTVNSVLSNTALKLLEL